MTTPPRSAIASRLSVLKTGLPGWTVSYGPTDVTVTSPRGVMVSDTSQLYQDDDYASDTIDKLDQLGYQADLELYSSAPKQPKPDTPEPALQELDTAREEEPLSPKAKPKKVPDQTMFVYPDEPQRLTLQELLPPEAGEEDQPRYLYPKVIIDEEIAREFLSRAAKSHNRHQRKANVADFKRMMIDGVFQLTHQGLAFNINGELSDGQHRMRALVEVAEENPELRPEVIVDITYNLPVETAFALDGGAKRTNVDHANVAGLENPTIVARLVRNLHKHKYVEGRSANWRDVPKLTPQELVEWADAYGDQLMAAWTAVQPLKKAAPFNLNAAALWHFLALEAWSDAPVTDFINGVRYMEWDYRDDPRKALHRWVSNSYQRRVDMRHHLAHMVMAYNAYCRREPREATKWIPTWGIPACCTEKDVKKNTTRRRKAASGR